MTAPKWLEHRWQDAVRLCAAVCSAAKRLYEMSPTTWPVPVRAAAPAVLTAGITVCAVLAVRELRRRFKAFADAARTQYETPEEKAATGAISACICAASAVIAVMTARIPGLPVHWITMWLLLWTVISALHKGLKRG